MSIWPSPVRRTCIACQRGGPHRAGGERMTRRDDSREVIARAYRDEWGRVTATLIRHTGDWSLAEECAAEAFTRAIERWPDDGIPRNPGAWLTTVAKRLAIDRLRRQAVESHKVREAATMTEVEGGRSVGRRAGVPLPASAPDPTTTTPTRRRRGGLVGCRRRRRRRPVAARLHVLSSGARTRGPRRPHAAHPRRTRHGRDRPRVPRRGAHDGTAHRSGQGAHPLGGDPLPGAPALRPARAGRRRARGALPRLQRGLLRLGWRRRTSWRARR